MNAATRDLIRFHLRSGARVALRANGIVGATIVFVFALDMDALAHLRAMLLELVARVPGWGARGALAGICMALAAAAMPRVTLGSTGWMRSLPCPSGASRRAALVALGATQAFGIAVMIAALVAVSTVYHQPIDPAKVLALPLMIAAAAGAVLPLQRVGGRLAFGIALVLTIPGQWATDAIALVMLVLADAIAGRIVPFRSTHARRARGFLPGNSPVALWMRFSVRSVPGASLLAALILPAVFVAFAYLILRHNPDLDRATAARTVRVCGAFALAFFASALATTMVRARPAWPWGRSLPWSSRQRVMGDVLLHGVPLLALALTLVPLDWPSALVVLSLAPPLAAAAAASIRSGARRQSSAGGEIIGVAVVLGALVALMPLSCVLVAVSAPVIGMAAVRRDQRLLVTRWEELHHDAGGDPAWMAAS